MAKKPLVVSVDDDPEVRAVIADLLGGAGIEVHAAERLVDGIQLALSETPDLILLDLHMPEGDGFEACAAFKAVPELSGIPIVVVTGMRDKKHLEQAKVRGADVVLSKPIAADRLLAAVKRRLKRRR